MAPGRPDLQARPFLAGWALRGWSRSSCELDLPRAPKVQAEDRPAGLQGRGPLLLFSLSDSSGMPGLGLSVRSARRRSGATRPPYVSGRGPPPLLGTRETATPLASRVKRGPKGLQSRLEPGGCRARAREEASDQGDGGSFHIFSLSKEHGRLWQAWQQLLRRPVPPRPRLGRVKRGSSCPFLLRTGGDTPPKEIPTLGAAGGRPRVSEMTEKDPIAGSHEEPSRAAPFEEK